MTNVVIDDHLLRDLLTGRLSIEFRKLIRGRQVYTTNLYFHRLCRSVLSARGGSLTGSWEPLRRQALAERLTQLPEEVTVVPMERLCFRMAQIVGEHRISTLGAEALAAAEWSGAWLCVWEGDDGPAIRAGALSYGLRYRTIPTNAKI